MYLSKDCDNNLKSLESSPLFIIIKISINISIIIQNNTYLYKYEFAKVSK